MDEKTQETKISGQTKAKELSWSSVNIHNYIKAGILAVLFILLFHLEVYRIVWSWMTNPSWSHGFLIPFFSLYFLNQRKNDILSTEAKPAYTGLLIMIAAILLYPINAAQLQIGTLYPALMLPTIFGIVLFIGGWKIIKHTWLPILYLGFAIPIPQRLYRELTIPMRKLAAFIASALLSVVPELEAHANGVVIDVIYKGKPLEPALDVAEACSGMRLLMAFVALGVAMAWLHYRPMWQRFILLSATIPIAIICNIVRVTTTGFIYVLGNPKYAQGIYHDALGLAMLPLAFGFYGALAWFMSSLFVEEDQQEVKEDVIVRKKN